jgi:glycosyltransferase involved in cell wall biosynthesis
VRKAGLSLVHYNPLTVYSPLFVGKKTRRVATIHGAAPVFLPDQFSSAKVLHERYAVSYLARRMDHLFAVSRTTKDFISQKFSVASDRIDVIYNAVDPGFRRLEHAEKEASRFAQLCPFLFHLSKFSERKNPWTILRGFADLASAYSELRLVLGGAGWDNEKVRGFLDERGLGKRVVFPGFLEKQEIVELMNLAEAFVFPSLYEGFGMPNLEAMACGCPVITSRAFAIQEIVGEAAITMDNPFDAAALADAVSRIRRDRELRETLIERGLTRAAAFSWEESVRTMLAAYARLLELQ